MTNLSNLGGILFLLSFLHFIVDWGFQSHAEAISKSYDTKVRTRHCTIYTLGLAPLVYYISPDLIIFAISLFILWSSHFLIDTYIPVYLWAKHIRKMPSFSINQLSEIEKFKDMAKTPIGLILMIVMDQVFHMLFLVPIGVFSIWPEYRNITFLVTGISLLILMQMTHMGVKVLNTRNGNF